MDCSGSGIIWMQKSETGFHTTAKAAEGDNQPLYISDIKIGNAYVGSEADPGSDSRE